jgi:MFS family permease
MSAPGLLDMGNGSRLILAQSGREARGRNEAGGEMKPGKAMDGAATPAADSPLPSGWLGIVAIAAMVCGPAMVGMMLTIVLPILPNIAKDVSGGRNVLIAMPTMGIVAGGIAAGFLLSRVPARALMLWMTLAFGVVGVSGMLLGGWPLLASRFLMGVVSTCISAASTTLIGEHIGIDRRSRVLGFQMAGSSLAGIAAMNISGSLNDAYGWRASFLLFPAIAAIVFLAGWLLIPASGRPAANVAGERPGPPAGRLLLYLMLLAMHATAYTPNSQASFVLDDNGVSKGAVRAHVISINQAAIVLAAICYPFTRRVLGSRWIPAFFLTLMTIGLVLLGLSRDLTLVAVALVFLGFGNGTLFPHQSNLVLARAAPAIRGRAVGLMVSNQFLADSINPFIFPPLAVAVGGLHNAIVTVGLCAGLGVVGALIYGSRATNAPLPAGAKGFGH